MGRPALKQTPEILDEVCAVSYSRELMVPNALGQNALRGQKGVGIGADAIAVFPPKWILPEDGGRSE